MKAVDAAALRHRREGVMVAVRAHGYASLLRRLVSVRPNVFHPVVFRIHHTELLAEGSSSGDGRQGGEDEHDESRL